MLWITFNQVHLNARLSSALAEILAQIKLRLAEDKACRALRSADYIFKMLEELLPYQISGQFSSFSFQSITEQ